MSGVPPVDPFQFKQFDDIVKELEDKMEAETRGVSPAHKSQFNIYLNKIKTLKNEIQERQNIEAKLISYESQVGTIKINYNERLRRLPEETKKLKERLQKLKQENARLKWNREPTDYQDAVRELMEFNN